MKKRSDEQLLTGYNTVGHRVVEMDMGISPVMDGTSIVHVVQSMKIVLVVGTRVFVLQPNVFFPSIVPSFVLSGFR